MKKIIITLSFIGLLLPGVVIAEGGEGESDIGFLTSRPPEAPVLCSPADEAILLPDTIGISWHSQIHTVSYLLQISNEDNFSNLFMSQSLTDTASILSGFEKNMINYWRVCASNAAGNGDFSDERRFTIISSTVIDREMNALPTCFALLPVYPNPSNPMTTITYHLPERAEVSLVIYNCIGQSVQELVSGFKQAGEYRITWDGRDRQGSSVKSGLYLCLFETDRRVFTQKILLIR